MKKKNDNKNTWIIVVVVVIISVFVISKMDVITGEAPKGDKGGGGKVKAQCNDKIDNDGDGFCDFLTRKTRCNDGSIPGDPDCASKDDNKEASECEPVPERCDGFDNDCDGSIDEGLPIECSTTSNCGNTGWVGPTYCGVDGNVHRDWITYQCNFAGTCSSSCSSQTTDSIYEFCNFGCTNGQCIIGGNGTT